MADAPSPAALTWTPEGAPRSLRFDDVYFAAEGLAKSRAVFLAGCGLPEAWAGRDRFTVAELGFGTGLNVLALLDLWRSARPPGGRLHVFTVEAFPMTAEEAARALAAFPELADLAAPLLRGWPRVRRGWARIEIPELAAIIDVAVAEAAEALAGWSGRADAWFLDGFAPSRNPEMWRGEVLDLVAARSAPDARLATFTVAGAVRRGLAARGFTVDRARGHGRKRQRLEARLPGPGAATAPAGRVAVVGGGVAGAALVRAFRSLGVQPTVFDPAPGGGASGNPAALASPRLDVGGGPAAQLYAQAFGRAVALYADVPGGALAHGAVRLAAGERDGARFAALADSPLFPAGALEPLGPEAAAARLGETAAPEALWMRDAVTVAPARVLEAWLGAVAPAEVRGVERRGATWALMGADGAVLAEAETVVVAAGAMLDRLAGAGLIEPVRGQATWSGPLPAAPVAATWGGYAAPTEDGGVLFGATHDRGDPDGSLRAGDDERNLETLARMRPALAEAARAAPGGSRASVRAATPDRLPLAGELAPRLFVLGGLGGRGFTTAPLLAEHVAALVVGAPSPLPAPVADAVSPTRFSGRRSRSAEARVLPEPPPESRP